MRTAIFSIMLMLQCVSAGLTINSAVATPVSWIVNPPVDDPEYMYAVGGGVDAGAALRSALSSINGRIATVISSSISSSTMVSGDVAVSNFREDIKAKTFETKLSGYEVVASRVDAGIIYVLMRMSRRAFVSDTMLRLKAVHGRIINSIEGASSSSKLKRYLAIRQSRQDIAEASSLAYAVMAVDPGFNADQYLTTYRAYENDLSGMLYRLNFLVVASPELHAISESVVQMLGEQKISVVTPGSGVPDGTIRVTADTRHTNLFSEYLTRLDVTVQLTDASGFVISSVKHSASAASLKNYEQSMASASSQITAKLKQAGSVALLGIGDLTQPLRRE